LFKISSETNQSILTEGGNHVQLLINTNTLNSTAYPQEFKDVLPEGTTVYTFTDPATINQDPEDSLYYDTFVIPFEIPFPKISSNSDMGGEENPFQFSITSYIPILTDSKCFETSSSDINSSSFR